MTDMPDNAEKKDNRVKGYAIWIGILYLIMQHSLYLAGHYLASWFGFAPFLPNIITGVALAMAAYFICKKYHWGRMFRPAEGLYAAWKAKKPH